MCGLVGMAGHLEYRHKQVMKELLYLDALRGMDSTGLTSIKADRSVYTRKAPVPGYEFITFPVLDKVMSIGDKVWIGHNRYKTTGDINRANAHPFEVLDENDDVLLVGAHNGTLDNKFEIQGKLRGDTYDTDSEALFNWLAEAPNYKEAIGFLRGAWSLVWWDPTEDTLHFCRNKERPLTFAWSEDRKTFFWASEAWMLLNACRRNGIALQKNDRGLSCYSTLEDHLYSLAIPEEKDVVLPDLAKEGGFAGKPAAGFRHGYQGYGQSGVWWDVFDDDPNFDSDEPKAAAETKEKRKTTGSQDGSASNVITLGVPPSGDRTKLYRGHNGRPMNMAEVEEVKKKGCGWCKKPFPNGIAYAYLDDSTMVCGPCLRDEHPKDGDSVRQDNLDDEVIVYGKDEIEADLRAIEEAGLDIRPGGLYDKKKQFWSKNTPEYKRLIDAAVLGAKAVG